MLRELAAVDDCTIHFGHGGRSGDAELRKELLQRGAVGGFSHIAIDCELHSAILPANIILLPMDLAPEATTDTAAEITAPEPAPAEPRLKSPTVGVFDSGVGGFTVASAILKLRPDLNLVYYADSLNLPYGGREQAQLERF